MNLDIIKRYESLHDGDLSMIGLQPKLDPIGIWTEGWGHAMRDSNGNFIKGLKNKELAYKLSKIKTIEDADRVLEEDTKSFLLLIERKVTVPLKDNQKEALLSFCFNTGGSATLFTMINNKAKPADIFNWWTSHYISASGKTLKGLIFRRRTEALLFKDGIYQYFN